MHIACWNSHTDVTVLALTFCSSSVVHCTLSCFGFSLNSASLCIFILNLLTLTTQKRTPDKLSKWHYIFYWIGQKNLYNFFHYQTCNELTSLQKYFFSMNTTFIGIIWLVHSQSSHSSSSPGWILSCAKSQRIPFLQYHWKKNADSILNCHIACWNSHTDTTVCFTIFTCSWADCLTSNFHFCMKITSSQTHVICWTWALSLNLNIAVCPFTLTHIQSGCSFFCKCKPFLRITLSSLTNTTVWTCEDDYFYVWLCNYLTKAMVLNSTHPLSDKTLEGLYSAAFSFMYQALFKFQSGIDPTAYSLIINCLHTYSLSEM